METNVTGLYVAGCAIGGTQAPRRIGDDREECDDRTNHDFRDDAEAEPDRQQRHDRNDRDGVRHDDIGQQAALEKP